MPRKTSTRKTARKTASRTARKSTSRRSAKAATVRKHVPADGELIRLTALQLAILGSIESAPKREQYGSMIIQDVAKDLKLVELPLATVYTALRRLEQRGMLTSRWGPPGPDGGNRRRFYKTTKDAAKAARLVARVLEKRFSRRR